ncbi:acyltransferase family protein [Emticicia soli]|uniref:Acyltransferase family protein n=1 Tax=Emticicia soli TaxID=2027878 RepID=A0ABW5JFD6_9BACT
MKQRLTSLDVFRGMTIMLMTIVNNPGDWGNLYSPLEHAEWHGCTPTDLVFPFFLFVVGISAVLSMPIKRFDASTFERIITRTLRIFLLGLFLNFFSKIHIGSLDGVPLMLIRLVFTVLITMALLGDYDKRKQFFIAIGLFVLMLAMAFGLDNFKNVRIPGVLQRIAVVYLIISILYATTNTTTQIVIGLVCLFGYWALMTLVPVPGFGEANVEKGTNLAAWLDNYLLPGHLWATSKIWDPEGLLSTFPAIATGIAGLLTGTFLTNKTDKNKKPVYLIGAGVAGVALGFIWGLVFPINKALWTSTFVLYTAGWALLLLGILYFLIDVIRFDFWTKPFVIFGVNPMVVFFFSGIIPRVLNMIQIPVGDAAGSMGLTEWLYQYGIVPFFSEPKNASLAGALVYLLIWFVILLYFYRRKLIFKV